LDIRSPAPSRVAAARWPAQVVHDWLDEAHYRAIARLDRPSILWEWLRRNPEFQQASAGILPPDVVVQRDAIRIVEPRSRINLRSWTSTFAIPWTVSALDLPPFWLSLWDPSLLRFRASPCLPSHPAAIDVRNFGQRLWLAKSPEREVLALDLDCRRQLIEIVDGTLLDGPVLLWFEMDRWIGNRAQLRALTQLGWWASQFTFDHPDRKILRLATLLRVHDACQSGASHRDVAACVTDEGVVARDWCGSSDYLKSRAKRAIARARALAMGQFSTSL